MLIDWLQKPSTVVWGIYLSAAELSSCLPSYSFSCILVSDENHAKDYSGNQSCATMHEAIFRFSKFIWVNANHDNISAFAAVAVAVFTFTLWRSTSKLWEASEKQIAFAKESADAARDSIALARQEFEYTFRARVSIFDVAILGGGGDQKITTQFRVENTGRLPATGLTASYMISSGPDGHPPTRDTFYVAPQPEDMSLVLAARESKPREGALRDFTPEDYRKAKEHGTPHYLRFGIVVAYRDGFDNERITWKWFEWRTDIESFSECAARQD